MCLIMLQPKGTDVLTKETAEAAWQNNPDGAGFMLAFNGKLIVRKPFFRFKKFWKAYQRARNVFGIEAPFVIHWRIATHGGVTPLNTHPFTFAQGEVGIAHNGILPWLPVDDTVSDTRFFVEESLKKTTADESMTLDFADTVQELVGRTNKMVLLRADGEWNIVNEDEGSWRGEAWYSNTSSLYRYNTYFSTGGFSKVSSWTPKLDRETDEDWRERDWLEFIVKRNQEERDEMKHGSLYDQNGRYCYGE